MGIDEVREVLKGNLSKVNMVLIKVNGYLFSSVSKFDDFRVDDKRFVLYKGRDLISQIELEKVISARYEKETIILNVGV